MKRHPLAIIFLTVFVDLLGFGIVIPILPTYARSFGASGLAVGLLSTTYSAMQLLWAPFWGRLSDRMGRRPIIIMTAAGAAVAYATFGLGDALWVLFLARIVGGVCGANIATAQAYIADVTSPEERTRGMAIIGAGFGLGFTFGPALGGLMTHLAGVKAPFFLAAGLAALNAVWAALALPEPNRRAPAERRGRARALAHAWHRPRLALLLGLFLLLTYAFANIESTLALFTNSEHGFQERENAYLFTWIGLVLSLTQLLGSRRLSGRGERPLIVTGTALMGLGAMTVPLMPHGWQLTLPAALIACGNALNGPSLMASISKAAPTDRQGEILGLTQSVGAMGRILGPAAGGFLFDYAGHAWPYWSACVLMLAGAVIAARRV